MCELLNAYYSFGGRKFEHALKHGSKNGLFIVTLGWFVDSVKRNGNSELLFVIYVLVSMTTYLDVGCVSWELKVR